MFEPVQKAAVIFENGAKIVERMGDAGQRADQHGPAGICHRPDDVKEALRVVKQKVGKLLGQDPLLQLARLFVEPHTLAGECDPALDPGERRTAAAEDPLPVLIR